MSAGYWSHKTFCFYKFFKMALKKIWNQTHHQRTHNMFKVRTLPVQTYNFN